MRSIELVTLPMTFVTPIIPNHAYFYVLTFLHIPGMAEGRVFKYFVYISSVSLRMVNNP